MNSISKYLTHYFTQHFHKKKKNFFSTLSCTYFSDLFLKIHQSNLLWEETFFQEKGILSSDWNMNAYSYSTIENYEYIPLEIRMQWIENIPMKFIFQKKYSFYLANREFHIHLWFPLNTMTEKQIQEKIFHILKKIYCWLTVATSFLPKEVKCSNEVEIYLFLTEHVKFLPTSKERVDKERVGKERVYKEPINEIHTRTAFTTGCDKKKTTIFLFREEEWFKVFIHETFHNLGLDFNDIDSININNKIRETFPISVSDIHSYEAYAEIWAEIMNLLFVVYFQDPPRKKGRLPFIRWMDTLASLVEVQQTFSLFQANKILYYYYDFYFFFLLFQYLYYLYN